jgi:hypothetical protein
LLITAETKGKNTGADGEVMEEKIHSVLNLSIRQ